MGTVGALPSSVLGEDAEKYYPSVKLFTKGKNLRHRPRLSISSGFACLVLMVGLSVSASASRNNSLTARAAGAASVQGQSLLTATGLRVF